MEQYIAFLINKDINGIKNIGKGFYYNNNYKKVFNKFHEDVLFTKTQLKILLILLENNSIVSSDEIIHSVWKKENVSIFTLRNMIKQIRDKTYYEIIKNHSNKGYSINEDIKH